MLLSVAPLSQERLERKTEVLHRVGGEMATITPPSPLSPDEDANNIRKAFQGTTGVSTFPKTDKELCVRMHL